MDTFEAIADPVRREILVLLMARQLTAGEVADRFSISRPAISRHLRVLRETGLVAVEASGRRRVYRIETTPLGEVETWLQQFHVAWFSRLDALETEVHRTRRERERRERSMSSPSTASISPVERKEPA
ncbi:MAG TPA: metalloregulator ArsR/SmtB family transcription factor [Thermomicrobiales bacterium]|nr:metalloregulator ArsR/SmtB family transcription factor [Thermomicrobiales bacterium]